MKLNTCAAHTVHLFPVRHVPRKPVWGLGGEEGAPRGRGAEKPAPRNGRAEGDGTTGPAYRQSKLLAYSLRKQRVPPGPLKTARLSRVACGGMGARSHVPACRDDTQLFLGRGPASGTAGAPTGEPGCGWGPQRSGFRKSTSGPALPVARSPGRRLTSAAPWRLRQCPLGGVKEQAGAQQPRRCPRRPPSGGAGNPRGKIA